MIEYILARPFIVLFGISAFLFELVIGLYELHYSMFTITGIVVIIFLALLILFTRRLKFIVLFVFIVVVSLMRVILHLNENHIPFNVSNSFEDKETILVVNDASRFKNDFIINGEIVSENQYPLIRINIPTIDSISRLYYGDTLICKFKAYPVKPSAFRYFNSFNNFLYNQHIYYKARMPSSNLVIKRYSKLSIISVSQKISERCKEIFLQCIPDESTANLMVALLLGDKSSLDQTVKNDFINTGTAHILAVSGLHLGMIYVLLQGLIKLVKPGKQSRNKKLIEVGILLILIWLFSFISGLSTSVVRAAVMLTFFEFGKYLKRNSDQVNSLFGCGFLMLFYNPCTLYDIGFQLSFLAVLSIILFNPFVIRIINPENQYLTKLRDLISVTLSVQILVTPISVYYFQQFPLYFILSNMLWVPLSFIIMIFGIALLLVYLIIPILGIWLGYICIYLCKIGLLWFDVIRYLPSSKFDGLWIYPEGIVIYLISALLLFFWLKFFQRQILLIAVSLFLLLPILHFIRIQSTKKSNELVIYKERKVLQMDIRVGTNILTTCLVSKTMSNYRIAHQTSTIQEINNLGYSDSILLKNQIRLISLSPIDCKETLFHELPVKDPMIISYSKLSDSVQTKSQILITGNLNNAKRKTCNIIENNFSDSIHEIDIDGPFTLKF